MTNHRNKQNYRFRTWKVRDRFHLKGGVRQGCFLSLILNYLIQYIHYHSLYIMSHHYAKYEENPCVGTDARTPLSLIGPVVSEENMFMMLDDERRNHWYTISSSMSVRLR